MALSCRSCVALAVVLMTTSCRRDEPPAGAPSASVTIPAADAGARSVMHEHFVFKGDPAGRDAAYARVLRATAKYAAQPRRDMRMPNMANLEEHLKDHYVQVTPEGAILHVVTNPATNPSWDLSFDVSADDTMTNMVLGEDAPPPPR